MQRCDSCACKRATPVRPDLSADWVLYPLSVSVKGVVAHKGEETIRRVRLSTPTYARLLRVADGWAGGAALSVKYVDEEEDLVTVGGALEWQECVRMFAQAQSAVRIRVAATARPSAAARRPSADPLPLPAYASLDDKWEAIHGVLQQEFGDDIFTASQAPEGCAWVRVEGSALLLSRPTLRGKVAAWERERRRPAKAAKKAAKSASPTRAKKAAAAAAAAAATAAAAAASRVRVGSPLAARGGPVPPCVDEADAVSPSRKVMFMPPPPAFLANPGLGVRGGGAVAPPPSTAASRLPLEKDIVTSTPPAAPLEVQAVSSSSSAPAVVSCITTQTSFVDVANSDTQTQCAWASVPAATCTDVVGSVAAATCTEVQEVLCCDVQTEVLSLTSTGTGDGDVQAAATAEVCTGTTHTPVACVGVETMRSDADSEAEEEYAESASSSDYSDEASFACGGDDAEAAAAVAPAVEEEDAEEDEDEDVYSTRSSSASLVDDVDEDPEVRYAQQLSQIRRMGVTAPDAEVCQMLQEMDGNMALTVCAFLESF